MTAIELLLNQPWTARLGWTLVHFLWQGTLIAVLFAAVRGLAGRWLAPGARYGLACGALATMMAVPTLTLLAIGTPGPSGLLAPAGRIAAGDWEWILPWLVPVWMAGVAAFSLRLMAGWRWTRRLGSVGTGPAAPEWQSALEELTRRMRVAPAVRLLASSLSTVPAVVGWLRPLILMPVEALAGVPIEQVRALLAHELAHIRRHDYLVNILQSIVETLLFYHPAVWWVSQQIRAEREVCCDDWAVAATGDRLVYATALADIDSRRRAHIEAALAANGGSLVNRIRRLLGASQTASHDLPGPGMAWALSLLWLVGVGAAMLHSAPIPPASGATVSHRPFVAPSAIAAPQILLEAPPRLAAAPRGPVVSALLFDPFLDPPQAPAPPAAQTNQATLEGHVFNAIDGTPLEGARLKLTLALGSGEPVFAKTDAQGHFQFPRTTVGTYTLVAEQPGFLRTQETHSPQGPFILVDLVPRGMRVGGVEVHAIGPVTRSIDSDGSLHAVAVIGLTPYAVIAGTVTELNGLPRGNCPVEILAKRGNTLAPILTVHTDDRGEYRAARLAAGTYYVVADKAGPWTTTTRALRRTYYPRAIEAASAMPLVLAAGQQLRADIRMVSTNGVSVTGRVTNAADIGNASTRLALFQPEAAGAKGGMAELRGGEFEFKNVMPGQYTLMALARANTAEGGQGQPLYAAIQQVAVDEENPSRLEVDLQPLRDVPGTVTFAPGCRPVTVRVVVVGSSAFGMSRAEAASTGGAFTLSGLTPARHRAGVFVPFGYAATAKLNGREAGGDGFDYPVPEGGVLRIDVGCMATQEGQ